MTAYPRTPGDRLPSAEVQSPLGRLSLDDPAAGDPVGPYAVKDGAPPVAYDQLYADEMSKPAGDEPVPARRLSRIERAAMPAARGVLKAAAEEYGVCLRLVALRATDTLTGKARIIDVPCGATRASVCPSCAERARRLRAAQCREGWHLTAEPQPPDPVPTAAQRDLVTEQADLRYIRELTVDAHRPVDAIDADLADNAADQQRAQIRGTVPEWPVPDDDPDGDGEDTARTSGRRVRSTRRREDVPDLPRLPVARYTVGRTYPSKDGSGFRPSLFLTLTLPSYGPVRADGSPVDPATYDYRRAARDALHFGKLVDRYMQNLRRAVGWNVQYFAAVEPQKRGAPHLHAAIRGTIPRAVLRKVAAATYHQVWWPRYDKPIYNKDRPTQWPQWTDDAGYVDTATGEILPTWTEALDRADETGADPAHVARFGRQVNAQGVLSGHPQAGKLISYLTKYLTKHVAECHTPDTPAAGEHAARLVDALRWEPCSPRCPNWLLHGVQPQRARAGMRPGACKAAAHRPANLGYGGRRVLVSRWWSAKTLTDHRADRRAFALARIAQHQHDTDLGAGTEEAARDGHPSHDMNPGRWRWEYARPGQADVPALHVRIGRAIADRARWRRALRSQFATAVTGGKAGPVRASDNHQHGPEG
jgi:Replication initiator protein, pSAM2